MLKETKMLKTIVEGNKNVRKVAFNNAQKHVQIIFCRQIKEFV